MGKKTDEVNVPSTTGLSLNTRSRDIHRYGQARKGNRRMRQNRNNEHAEIDSSPESYRNVLMPLAEKNFSTSVGIRSKEKSFKDINVGDVSHSQNNPSSANEIEIVKWH